VILNRVIVLLFDGEDVMMQEKKTTMLHQKANFSERKSATSQVLSFSRLDAA